MTLPLMRIRHISLYIEVDMKKKIAVLGANYQYLSFYRQAKALGYEIYAFGRAADDHVSAEKYADHFYDISFKEQERILDICKKEGVHGVTSFLIESALPFVYYISRGLGVPCNSPECEAYTANKYAMREQLQKMNLTIPEYQAIHSLSEWKPMQMPVIVKPVDSGGSRGVSLVRSEMDMRQAVDRALDWSAKGLVMVEQYIEGREFSVETISYQGKHHILQITDKLTTEAPYFVEIAHHQPAVLAEKQKMDIQNLTLRMLDALHVTYGAGHTEIKMNKAGVPYIIEMGPRMGGDFISSDLVRLSTGYDFVSGVLEIATGTFHEPHFGLTRNAGVFFLCKETETKLLPYIQNRSDYPFVVDADIWGDIQTVQCNSDRGGYLIYQSNQKIEI